MDAIGPLACTLLLIFGIPFFAGLRLLFYPGGTRLTRMAGWLTLKPLLTTPAMFRLSDWLAAHTDVSPWFAVPLPGAALTLVAVIIFWSVIFDSQEETARWLIALDCARWITTTLFIGFFRLPIANQPIGFLGLLCFGMAALSLPTIFALLAGASIPTLVAPISTAHEL